MSRETLATLNSQTLIGYTDKRGNAWHYRADLQAGESNHYLGAIPLPDIYRRLFGWKAVEGELRGVALTDEGVIQRRDPERKTIQRSDNGDILGVFKHGYQIHQYDEWLVKNVEAILDADLQVGSAGLLRNGAVAWVQIEMEETVETEGVQYRPFLTAATSLDGSLATTYLTGAQVVVCDNTLSLALGSAQKAFKVRHSANSLGRVTDVRDALSIIYDTTDAFQDEIQQLTAEKVSDARWARFVAAYTEPSTDSKRAQNNADKHAATLNRLWHHDQRVSPWKGTAYGVLAATNTYLHHEQDVRGATRVTRNTERMVHGQVGKHDAHTLDTLARV